MGSNAGEKDLTRVTLLLVDGGARRFICGRDVGGELKGKVRHGGWH
jgi:hypothetical protein